MHKLTKLIIKYHAYSHNNMDKIITDYLKQRAEEGRKQGVVDFYELLELNEAEEKTIPCVCNNCGTVLSNTQPISIPEKLKSNGYVVDGQFVGTLNQLIDYLTDLTNRINRMGER